MTILDPKCFSKKIHKLARNRMFQKKRTKKNITRKLSNQPNKYLTQKELYTLNCVNNNDIYNKIIKTINLNPGKSSSTKDILDFMKINKKKLLSCLVQKNIKHYLSILKKQKYTNNNINKNYFEYNHDYHIFKQLENNYHNLKIEQNCNTFNLIHVEKLAKKFDFFHIKGIHFDPIKTKVSFCVDFVGDRNYYFFIKDLINKEIKYIDLCKNNKNEKFISIHDTLSMDYFGTKKTNFIQMSEDYTWIDSESIIYISYDTYYNVNKCYTYNIRTQKRRLIYKETRGRMLSIITLHSGFYYALYSSSYNDDEIFLLDIEEENLETHKKKVHILNDPIVKYNDFVTYPYLNHIDATWYFLKNVKGKITFMKTMNWKSFETLIEFKNKHDNIKHVIYVANKFVFFIQNKQCYKLHMYDICSSKYITNHSINNELCDLNLVNHIEPLLPYGQLINNNQYIFQSMSFTKYGDIFSLRFDINNNVIFEKHALKNKKIRKLNNICNEKTIYLNNNNIMITILYKKGTKLSNRKCLVYGYGCYGDSYESKFNYYNLFEMCELGYIIVICHVSGDNKLGYKQYMNGVRDTKKNSMNDIIYICDYLIKQNITKKEKLALWGRSAGGLLMSSVINMRPDLCSLVIMGVPFLTPIETMSSGKNPLGLETHSELGNINDKKMKEYIQSYSPIENINNCAKYPNIFIYANLNDTLTPYKETVQYVKKMENVDVFKNGSRDLLVYLDEKFGHKQGTKLCDKYYIFALVLSAMKKYLED